MTEIKRPRISATIPTSSMADIAFLLIVFFLVTTSLSRDKGLGLTLPKSGAVTPVPARNIANVWINGPGQIALNGKETTLAALGENIRTMTRANPALIVSIKTAPDARYEAFVAVVDEIRNAGNNKISIAEPDLGQTREE